MKKSIFVTLSIIFYLSVNLSFGQDNDYQIRISNDRTQKNSVLKESQNSPIPPDLRPAFQGLGYYPVDLKYKLSGTLISSNANEIVKVNTTSGQTKDFVVFGKVKIIFEGVGYELLIFRNNDLPQFAQNPDQLFILFMDNTTGTGSSDYGRFLPVSVNAGSGQVEVDFNKAINSYYDYNKDFEGLIPPQINVLNFMVESGERKYEDR